MTTTTYDDKLAALSLEEKVRLLTGATAFTLHGEERIGLADGARANAILNAAGGEGGQLALNRMA